MPANESMSATRVDILHVTALATFVELSPVLTGWRCGRL
jgi:hypothetical protein